MKCGFAMQFIRACDDAQARIKKLSVNSVFNTGVELEHILLAVFFVSPQLAVGDFLLSKYNTPGGLSDLIRISSRLAKICTEPPLTGTLPSMYSRSHSCGRATKRENPFSDGVTPRKCLPSR